MVELNASFSDPERAREAERKLQALRARDIQHSDGGTSLSASIEDGIVSRALHLIEETGGTADLH